MLLNQIKDALPSERAVERIFFKKEYSPNFIKLKDKDGNRVGPSRCAEAQNRFPALRSVENGRPA